MMYTDFGLARRSEEQYPLLSGQLSSKGCFQRGKQCTSNYASAAAAWRRPSPHVLGPLAAREKVNLFGLSTATMHDSSTPPNSGAGLYLETLMPFGTQDVVTTTSNSKVDTCTVSSSNRYLGANCFHMRLFITETGTNGITTRQIFR